MIELGKEAHNVTMGFSNLFISALKFIISILMEVGNGFGYNQKSAREKLWS